MTVQHPEYLHIECEPTQEAIRELLRYMVNVKVSSFTAKLFGTLAMLHPRERLVLNLRKATGVLMEHKVRDVLKDGLITGESDSLLELDSLGCPDAIRKTARSMLNVKERWIMSKCLSGIFNRARASDAYIDIGGTP